MTRARRMSRVVAALSAAALVACAPDAPEPQAEPASAIPEAPADVVESADWSADGGRLAVAWTHGERTRVYGLLAPYDSTPPGPSTGLPITSGEGSSPTWSPDGLWLAFATTRDGNGEIYRVRPDGTGPEDVTRNPADDGEPTYAPDGRHIAFVSTRAEGGVPRVWIMGGDGEDPRPLGEAPAGAQHAPAWSADGRRVALAVGEGRAAEVWVVGADGSAAERVTEGSAPAWSRDGSTLFYARSDSLFARSPARAEGEERYVTDGRAPRASPNGRWLAFVRGNRTSSALYLLDLRRSTESRITP